MPRSRTTRVLHLHHALGCACVARDALHQLTMTQSLDFAAASGNPLLHTLGGYGLLVGPMSTRSVCTCPLAITVALGEILKVTRGGSVRSLHMHTLLSQACSGMCCLLKRLFRVSLSTIVLQSKYNALHCAQCIFAHMLRASVFRLSFGNMTCQM